MKGLFKQLLRSGAQLSRFLLLTFLFTVLSGQASAGSNTIEGDWLGQLGPQFGNLRLVVHIQNNDGTWTANFDSPDQGAKGIPTEVIEASNTHISTSTNEIAGAFAATLKQDRLHAKWTQMGSAVEFVMERITRPLAGQKRPQEPKAPFDYRSIDVRIPNKAANVELAGTLTLPKKAPIKGKLVLVTGSGPQDRNSELVGHKPFLVIADYLTQKGYAILRYDDRGFGESTGDFWQAHIEDLTQDAASALDFLYNYKKLKDVPMGILGHSEGGFIAGALASNYKELDFAMLLAAPGIDGSTLYREQIEAVLTAEQYPMDKLPQRLQLLDKLIDVLKSAKNEDDIRPEITPIVTAFGELDGRTMDEAALQSALNAHSSNTLRDFIKLTPSKTYKNITIPTLAINGELDLQVLPKSNLSGLQDVFKGEHKKYLTIKEFEKLNHLFQPTQSGRISEYAMIEQTIAPEVLSFMQQWLDSVVTQKSTNVAQK